MRRAAIAASLSALVTSVGAPGTAADVALRVAPVAAAAERAAAEDGLATAPIVAPWASALGPLRFVNVHGGEAISVSLYGDDGALDPAAVASLSALLRGDEADPEQRAPAPRLLQLVVKAADHFHAREVIVVSQWRPDTKARALAAREALRARIANGGREPLWNPPPAPPRQGSRHASGEAMDFFLSGVASRDVAAYLRTLAKVGVGTYTHPRTGFVHLDVRAESFHWVDASPPGRSWREAGITDHGAAARDLAYDPRADLPDSAR
ncbi:MAG TPA: DUF882 domain-containing protein [Polyangia bacterium]|nr:DUF882 domain-containing protein [Polyangia bacterium]